MSITKPDDIASASRRIDAFAWVGSPQEAFERSWWYLVRKWAAHWSGNGKPPIRMQHAFAEESLRRGLDDSIVWMRDESSPESVAAYESSIQLSIERVVRGEQ